MTCAERLALRTRTWRSGGRRRRAVTGFEELFEIAPDGLLYDVVLIGSPIWNVRQTYRDLSGARISAGLAVRGETVRQADPQVGAWLRRINLLR